MSRLQLRLKSCLQTILEMEPSMHARGENSFDEEFSSIKAFLGHIDDLELAEAEVQWMENVTMIVLAEMGQCGAKACPDLLQ